MLHVRHAGPAHGLSKASVVAAQIVCTAHRDCIVHGSGAVADARVLRCNIEAIESP
jgi:hypothetical protein